VNSSMQVKKLNDEQLIANGSLTKDMLIFLENSLGAGVSMLVISSDADIANSFLALLIDRSKYALRGITICRVKEDEVLLPIDDAIESRLLAYLNLYNSSLEKLREIQKVGCLVLHTLTSAQGYDYLKALLQGQVLASFVADQPLDAFQKLQIGICQHIAQLSNNVGLDWITRYTPLVVYIEQVDGQMRVNLADAGQMKADHQHIPYLYRYESSKTVDGQFLAKFVQETKIPSFSDRLKEVGYTYTVS